MEKYLTYIFAGAGVGFLFYALWKSIQTGTAQEPWEEPWDIPSIPSNGIDNGIDRIKVEASMKDIEPIIRASISAAGVKYNVAPPTVSEIKAIIDIESSWNPFATGSANEVGLMQIKLDTARWLGYDRSHADLYLPVNNVRYGAYYLAYWKSRGMNQEQMASCYNAGHLEYAADGKFKNQRYVDKFKRALEKY